MQRPPWSPRAGPPRRDRLCGRRPCSSRASSSAARLISGLEAARLIAATSDGTSPSPAGTLIATSSGSSRKAPMSVTTSGLPSESARTAVAEVSPIVGERSETTTSQAAISDHSSSSGT